MTPILPPPLYIRTRPQWLQSGAFVGPLFSPTHANSHAGKHLTSLHSDLTLNLDTKTKPKYQYKSIVLHIWQDLSCLIGKRENGAISWYGIPLALEKRLIPPHRTRASKKPRFLDVSAINTATQNGPDVTLQFEGPTDLKSAFQRSLEDALLKWDQYLGPERRYGPDTALSPCAPLLINPDTIDLLTIAGTALLHLPGGKPNSTLFFHGYQPGKEGWEMPKIGAQNLGEAKNNIGQYLKILRQKNPLLNWPHFVQPQSFEEPVHVVTLEGSSAHTVFESFATLQELCPEAAEYLSL